MNKINKISRVLFCVLVLITESGCESAKSSPKKFNIQIILGSTRPERLSDKLAKSLKAMVNRTDVSIEIVDLRDYNLPFLNTAIAPASITEISDPFVKKWSDKIKQANAFIIVTPEYNSGYPGVLKNAFDSIYKEWNNKPVAIVSYSGGPSGGTSVTNQLITVTKALQMIPVSKNINIPNSWKAFDENGNLVDNTLSKKFNDIIDLLVAAK